MYSLSARTAWPTSCIGCWAPRGPGVGVDVEDCWREAIMKRILTLSLALVSAGLSSAAVASVGAVPVPEPGTFGLLVAGVAGIVAVMRLRGRK